MTGFIFGLLLIVGFIVADHEAKEKDDATQKNVKQTFKACVQEKHRCA